MKDIENFEKAKADISEDNNDNDNLLKKRQDKDDQGNKSMRVVMPSVPGPFISKEEFVSLQKAELSDHLLNKYYDRYITMYKEEETRYYIEQNQDNIWFSDLYNPFTGQKLEVVKLKNDLKKHNLFVNAIDSDWLKNFKIGIDNLTYNTENLKQIQDFKLAEGLCSDHLTPTVRSIYGESEYIIDGLPKDVSIYDIWVQFVDNNWFWSLDASLPVKHQNYTRVVYITTNPIAKESTRAELASIDINNYSFKLHEYKTTTFDVYCKSYNSEDDVKNELSQVYSLINKIFTKHEIDKDVFFDKLKNTPHSKKLSILIYYLWIVWGINIVSKTRINRNSVRKLVILTNSETFTIDESFVPEIKEDSIYNNLAEDLIPEGSEDRTSSLVNKKVEAKIKSMLEEYEEGVWPCPKCGKFFENADYVVKHFNQKHMDKVEKYRSEFKLEIKSTDFSSEKYKDVLIGNYVNKINYNPFKEAIIYREMEKLKDKQALKLNYRWKYIEEY